MKSYQFNTTAKNLLAYILCASVLFAISANNAEAYDHEQLKQGVLLGDIDKLRGDAKPSENFDLLDWHLTLPVDTDKDGKADTIQEPFLANKFEIRPLFFTANDGGLVFVAPNKGATTSKGTKYTRTELREMLRRGDRSVKTKGVNKNNWVFSSMHRSGQRKAGGVDGSLEATVAVNRVSTTGDIKKVGRVIIGQIHATKNEPIRLYYRKLPGNDKGSIYFAHEANAGEERWINLVGTRSHKLENPEDGIELNELFSYKISVIKNDLTVTLIRQGKPNITKTVDMSESGYKKANQYMYFKAGVYNQNNTGESNDFVQATFYHIHNEHKGYEY